MNTAAEVAKWLRSVAADHIISGHQLGGQPGYCICGAAVWTDSSRRRKWRRTLQGHILDVLADEISGRKPAAVRKRVGETP